MAIGIDGKRCPRCQQVLPCTAFSKDSSRPDGRQVWCKACERLNRQSRRRKDKNAFYLRKYGISLDTAEEQFVLQHGKCAICGTDNIKLVPDHCHNTKRFRGLLCQGCNLGLGQFNDNIPKLEAAIAYLR